MLTPYILTIYHQTFPKNVHLIIDYDPVESRLSLNLPSFHCLFVQLYYAPFSFLVCWFIIPFVLCEFYFFFHSLNDESKNYNRYSLFISLWYNLCKTNYTHPVVQWLLTNICTPLFLQAQINWQNISAMPKIPLCPLSRCSPPAPGNDQSILRHYRLVCIFENSVKMES